MTTVATSTSPRQPAAATPELIRLLGQSAAAADETGTLTAEVVPLVTAAGFPAHFAPADHGGAEGRFAALVDAVVEVGQLCPSTAWCAVIFASNSRFAAHLPAAGQQRIWANGPDELIASGLAPTGQAEPVASGFRLSGRWSYISGAKFAHWVLVAARVADSPNRYFAVPRGQFRVERTWQALGMRATGSDTVVITDVVVPADLTVPVPAIMAGRNPVHRAGVFNVPLASVAGLTCLAPALGAARGALAGCVDILAAKGSKGPLELATAAAEISGVATVAGAVADSLDAGSAAEHGMANARDIVHCGRVLRNAVDRLVAAAGTSALARPTDLQRFWRDVTVATTHPALSTEVPARSYLEQLLGPDRNGR